MHGIYIVSTERLRPLARRVLEILSSKFDKNALKASFVKKKFFFITLKLFELQSGAIA